MPDTSPTPVDSELTHQIAAILDKPSVYMGGPSRRSLRLAGEIVDLLRSRASIGPDSERIRELEAENERLLKAYDQRIGELTELGLENARLRAAGLLPGPDDIVVSREALTTYLLSSDPHELEIANQILCAALSQPPPAQEQTP